MYTGKVKWFNNAKGYGFILSDKWNEDLFAHYSAIDMEGFKTLKAGQEVEFETTPGPKGTHAVKIRPRLGSASYERRSSARDIASREN